MSKSNTATGTTIELRYPLEHGETPIRELTIRRPKVGDLLAAKKTTGGDAEQEIAMFASLTGVAPAVLRELDMADYGELQQVYQAFLS